MQYPKNMKYQELGYDTYDEYINSEEWRSIHDYIYRLKLFSYHCRICRKKKALLLHKRSYAYLTLQTVRNLSKRKLKQIFVWLCHDCNTLIHFYTKTKKVPLCYLFLSERERLVWLRPDKAIMRSCRAFWDMFVWIRHSYSIHPKRHL